MIAEIFLYYFFSFSVPEKSIQTALDELSRVKSIQVTGVLMGIERSGFDFLNKNTSRPRVIIDPRIYTEYNIKDVPAFVLVYGENIYTIHGDIPPVQALDIFYKHLKRGDLKKSLEEVKIEYRDTRKYNK